MPPFSDFEDTETLQAAHDAAPEIWIDHDSYEVGGYQVDLRSSTYGRWRVVQHWKPPGEKSMVYQDEFHATEVYQANCRVLDRKYGAAAAYNDNPLYGRF